MKEYYIFDTEQIALAAEAYLSIVGGAPVVCARASNGEILNYKQKVERYSIPIQRADSKWVFARVPLKIRSKFPSEIATYFDTEFPHTLEEYDTSWFPSGHDAYYASI